MEELNEQDLDNLIDAKLSSDACKNYHQICALVSTPTGKERVVQRIKEMITKDGITSLDAVLAQMESDLIMSNDE
jgi:hypothetical protein